MRRERGDVETSERECVEVSQSLSHRSKTNLNTFLITTPLICHYMCPTQYIALLPLPLGYMVIIEVMEKYPDYIGSSVVFGAFIDRNRRYNVDNAIPYKTEIVNIACISNRPNTQIITSFT